MCCKYRRVRMPPLTILYGIFHVSLIWVKIWPWGLGHQRTPVEGQCVPVETATNSSNSLLQSLGVLAFCHISKSNSQFPFSCSRPLKPLRSRSQNTKHFDSVLRHARDMDNWNFVTSELWPHFLGQGQSQGHDFHISVLPPSRTIPAPACQHL